MAQYSQRTFSFPPDVVLRIAVVTIEIESLTGKQREERTKARDGYTDWGLCLATSRTAHAQRRRLQTLVPIAKNGLRQTRPSPLTWVYAMVGHEALSGR